MDSTGLKTPNKQLANISSMAIRQHGVQKITKYKHYITKYTESIHVLSSKTLTHNPKAHRSLESQK